MDTPGTNEFAHIGKSVIIKGELSGSEDLFVDGVVEGTIELRNNNLIIGPNGKVKANIHAKGVVVQGKLDGDIRASQRAELRKSAVAVGDVFTQRIAIEEGAYFKGKGGYPARGREAGFRAGYQSRAGRQKQPAGVRHVRHACDHDERREQFRIAAHVGNQSVIVFARFRFRASRYSWSWEARLNRTPEGSWNGIRHE